MRSASPVKGFGFLSRICPGARPRGLDFRAPAGSGPGRKVGGLEKEIKTSRQFDPKNPRMKTASTFTLLAVVLLLSTSGRAFGQVASSSLTVTVFADGSTAVAQTLAVNQSDTSVRVPLLTAIFSDVLATDQSGNPLSFQISGGNITIYTVGATGVELKYDTADLTSKRGTVWTLNFSTPYNATVVLPQRSTLTSVSGTPILLSEQNGAPVVVVGPGTWRLDYGVPVEIGTTSTQATGQGTGNGTSTSASGGQNTQEAGSQPGDSLFWPLASVGAAAVIVVVAYAVRSRGRLGIGRDEASALRPDDVKVLDFIAEKGGKVFELEIRGRFALPKTSGWRQIKRLERLGYVKVTKIGSQNQIELIKDREKPPAS